VTDLQVGSPRACARTDRSSDVSPSVTSPSIPCPSREQRPNGPHSAQQHLTNIRSIAMLFDQAAGRCAVCGLVGAEGFEPPTPGL
jgi:hypothetical protein